MVGKLVIVIWFLKFFCLCHLKTTQDDFVLFLDVEFALLEIFYFGKHGNVLVKLIDVLLCLYMFVLETQTQLPSVIKTQVFNP